MLCAGPPSDCLSQGELEHHEKQEEEHNNNSNKEKPHSATEMPADVGRAEPAESSSGVASTLLNRMK